MRHTILAALACLPMACAPIPAPEPASWSLVGEDRGNAYVLDHGLTLDDCDAAYRALPKAIGFDLIYCEREGLPLLVGYGCEGASAPLYAVEESDFPQCDRIERAAP